MKYKSVRVLLIEKDPADARQARQLLAEAGNGRFQLEHVDCLAEGLRRLREDHFDTVLLDVSPAAGSGLEAIAPIIETAPHAAIVALSKIIDENLALQVVQAGAQDFLVKWQGDGFLLVRSIRYAIEHKREKDHLMQLACYDELTGLTNRTLFRELLDKALFRAGRNGQTVALMFLDLDNFKVINDTLGHDVGDSLLRLVAQRLQGCVRTSDVIARLGGDEFTVIQERVERMEDVEAVARKIIHVMGQPFVLDHHELFVGTSIGIALFPGHGRDAETLLKNADTAMYHAKEQGRNNYQFYLTIMGERARRRLQMERNLHHALKRDEMVVYYQPQFRIQSQEVVAAEVLLRWRPGNGERLLVPRDFISVAEETGLIVPIGEWLIRSVCAQHRQWREAGLPAVRLGVNLSSRQLRHPDLPRVIGEALADNDMEARYLEVELNEGLMMESAESNGAALHKLKSMGVSISIDNFGSGAFSLSCLKHLPVDALKIDKSFIHHIDRDPANAAITTAIIAMARSLHLGVVAEGVENGQELNALLEKGCFLAQGNYFSPPVSAAKFLELVRASRLRLAN